MRHLEARLEKVAQPVLIEGKARRAGAWVLGENLCRTVEQNGQFKAPWLVRRKDRVLPG